jgi:DNA-binding PadR family transcriptional regulator
VGGELDAEEFVLAFLNSFKCGTRSDELATFARVSEGFASAALERLRSNGDAEREGESVWFYRITEQGRARLKAGR